jgi:hypothetical protein
MIVYRSGESAANPAELLGRIRSLHRELESAVSPLHDKVQTLLIEFGEFEAAVMDSMDAGADGSSSTGRVLRRAAIRLGHVCLRSWRQQHHQDWLGRLGASLAEISILELPAKVQVPVSEGYAYYGLYPEMYVAAAERFANTHEAGDAVVIGIRSIGASLSAVVEATLQNLGWRTHSWTVRPSGHEFNRTLHLSDWLEADLRARAGAVALVVDEGPGLSGSSFACVARALAGLGFPTERIVFLPSWDADGSSFVNRAAAQEWSRHRRYTASFEEVCLGERRRLISSSRLHDISAGKWRDTFCESPRVWPAVQPQHEARKYLAGGLLLKFAGLGRYGEQKLEIGRLLSDEGFVPAVAGLNDGFLANKLASGASVYIGDSAPRELIERAAAYLAWRKRNLPRPRSLSFDQLLEMIALNCFEATGTALELQVDFELQDREATAIDGRMLAHEWIATQAGFLKTDAVDHHADHFFPGDGDIAWDLAAACIEFKLDGSERRYLLERYRSLSGDRVSDRVLRFYEIAWLAFRTGYATLASDAVGPGAEYARFARRLHGYRRVLRSLTESWKEPCLIPALAR